MQYGYSREQKRDISTDAVEDSSKSALDLSVVIVTYNEQARIRDCLESVFNSCTDLVSYEVILVDSNSTDETVDIALEYPITVAQIPDEELTTPSAGRYVGTTLASGPAILFIDGDMILNDEWLEEAIDILEQPKVAAVDGHLNEPQPNGIIEETDAVRGIALYDTDTLETVGGFDPYLQSMEDIHLGYTVKDAGYTLLRLPSVAGYHPSRPTVTEPLRRWKRGYMIGTGQVVRKSIHNPQILGQYLSRLRYQLFVILWLSIGVVSILAVPLLLIWFTVSVVGTTFVLSRLGVRETFGFFFGKIIGIPGFLRGLTLTPREPHSYPLTRVQVLQTGPVHQKPSSRHPPAQ